MKLIDDLSYVHALDLKKCLKQNTTSNIPQPVTYHERTGHFLPESKNVLQQKVIKL